MSRAPGPPSKHAVPLVVSWRLRRRAVPLEVSHLGAERRRYPRLPSHRLWAKSPDSQLAVGRSEGLRRQIPHLQQRQGFPGFPKFTYKRLSEVGRRSSHWASDDTGRCATKAI